MRALTLRGQAHGSVGVQSKALLCKESLSGPALSKKNMLELNGQQISMTPGVRITSSATTECNLNTTVDTTTGILWYPYIVYAVVVHSPLHLLHSNRDELLFLLVAVPVLGVRKGKTADDSRTARGNPFGYSIVKSGHFPMGDNNYCLVSFALRLQSGCNNTCLHATLLIRILREVQRGQGTVKAHASQPGEIHQH